MYSWVRRIFFPIYGLDQLLFFAGLAVLALLVATYDPHLALYVGVGGYVGAMLTMQVSTPSALLLPAGYEQRIVQILDAARFLKRTGNGDEWMSSRGRLYRWNSDVIRVERRADGVLVTGRHYDLQLLAAKVTT